ncbi:uncharacterized protein LOC144703039 [Wolffia australiana]
MMSCGGGTHEEGAWCLDCEPESYIRMVQHLIEKCLVLGMGRDDTAQALSTRAGIPPLITLTVWKELLKENRGFFLEYFREIAFNPPIYKPQPRKPSFSRRTHSPCNSTIIEECQRREQPQFTSPPS